MLHQYLDVSAGSMNWRLVKYWKRICNVGIDVLKRASRTGKDHSSVVCFRLQTYKRTTCYKGNKIWLNFISMMFHKQIWYQNQEHEIKGRLKDNQRLNMIIKHKERKRNIFVKRSVTPEDREDDRRTCSASPRSGPPSMLKDLKLRQSIRKMFNISVNWFLLRKLSL